MEASEDHSPTTASIVNKGISRVSKEAIQDVESQSTEDLEETRKDPPRNSHLGRDDQHQLPPGENDIRQEVAELDVMGPCCLRGSMVCAPRHWSFGRSKFFFYWHKTGTRFMLLSATAFGMELL